MKRQSHDQSKRVGIWVRVSTEDQARGDSPEHHEKRARAYAEARGWHVEALYRLDGVSGKAIIAHPEAKRMLADIKSGEITGLVFSKLARLARSTKELLEISELFRAASADMISLQESIDTSSPAGRLFFTMIAAMAQWEREEIADRVAASVPIRAKLGKQISGASPYGYRWRDKKLVPDPKEAPIRVLMYELFKDIRRKKAVARELNDRGYRTRNGSRFSDTTVDRLIRDPTAKGIFRQNYTRTNDRNKSWELKPESDWVLTPVEPIISEALWAECNAFLNTQLRSRRKATRRTAHLFAGFAHCACGHKMYVWSNSPKYVCPDCRNKIPTADLEVVFRDQLQHFVVSPDAIAAHLAAANENLSERERLIESAQAELAKVISEENNLFRLHSSGELPTQGFGHRYKPLNERRKQLEDELPRLQAQADVLRINTLSHGETLEEARNLASHWDDLPMEEKRQIVEAITDKIVIGRDDVEISLLHIPSETSDGKATRHHGFIAATS